MKMRGRSSNTKARLRSAGYKCNMCGRRFVDASSLARHQKNEHNFATRSSKATFKKKPVLQKNKEKGKAVDSLKEDLLVESKPKPRASRLKRSLRGSKTIIALEAEKLLNEADGDGYNDESLPVEEQKADKNTAIKIVPSKEGREREVLFECPLCFMTFKVYFTAHKHIQKAHARTVNGKKGSLNKEWVPLRVEDCNKCNHRIKSNAQHQCLTKEEESHALTKEYMCVSCNQTYVSMKGYDQHVAGLHSEGVDSMFFPTKLEFTNWRLEMERQTSGKYTLLGEYDAKKIYRCQYSREELKEHKCIAHYCPSSIIVRDFSKGIQVHFYSKHSGHDYKPYTLTGKYRAYSITSFLKTRIEDSCLKKPALALKQDDKDHYTQFKKLMEGIVLSAVHADVVVVKKLIDKALEMSALLTDAGTVSGPVTQTKQVTNITDKEITEELELNPSLKRRKSVDSYETPLKPAKRLRNKSLYIQSNSETSPKIVNTFSLASNINNKEDKSDSGVVSEAKTNVESDTSSNKSVKISSKVSSVNDSLSTFNDSYKDFIDKNFVGIAEKIKNPKPRSTVKTRLGLFKPTSPRRAGVTNASNDSTSSNNSIEETKLTTPVEVKSEEANDTNTWDSSKESNSNVDILSVDNPSVIVTKITIEKPDNAKNVPKTADTSKGAQKGTSKGSLSHPVDTSLINMSSVSKPAPSPVLEDRKVISKSNTSSFPMLTIDPLELSVNVKTENTISVASPSIRKPDTPKVYFPKETPRLKTFKPNILKGSSHKLCPSKKNIATGTKTQCKVSFDDAVADSANTSVLPSGKESKASTKKVKDLVYEVREREGDCNILVLKI